MANPDACWSDGLSPFGRGNSYRLVVGTYAIILEDGSGGRGCAPHCITAHGFGVLFVDYSRPPMVLSGGSGNNLLGPL